MSTFNQNSGTAVPTLINSSAVLVTGNAASANALTVRQFGGGNVFSAQTSSGGSALFVGANGNVGVGTASPLNTLDVYGSQTIRNPTFYNTSTLGWYNIGLWDASVGTGGNNGQRLRLELIGGEGYDTNTAAQWGGVTTIYATIMNNASGSVANCGGTWKHDGSMACVSAVKFVQNGANRNQYYVYANLRTYTQHGLKIDTTQGSAFTPSFTSTTDPGADSATVRAAVFSMIAGYGTGGYVGIGNTNPGAPLHVNGQDAILAGTSTVSYSSNVLQLYTGATGTGYYQYSANLQGFNDTTGSVLWRFNTVNNGTSYPNNLVMKNGYVGIGTIPTAQLCVQATSSASGRTDFTGDAIEMGVGRSADGPVFLDMHTAEATYSDYSFRIIRYGGANGNTDLTHRGTGNFNINGLDASAILFLTSGAERMRITYGGYVGIGTNNPAYNLDVIGSMRLNGNYTYVGGNGGASSTSWAFNHIDTSVTFKSILWGYANSGGNAAELGFNYIGSGSASNYVDFGFYGSRPLAVTYGGRVGIGITNPTYPLHVVGSVASGSSAARYFNNPTPLTTTAGSVFTVGIYAQNDIGTSGSFVAFSDRRAKVLEESPTESYMNLVNKIQVHQYSWINKIDKGSTKKIGFFAQEVEEVVPDAVGHTTAVVPTIYREADAFTETTITVTNHGLTTEKKLEIVDPENGKTKVDIVRVIDSDNLEVKFEKVPKDKLFVVGPEVDDSRVLNHDHLMAVGFGGLKELSALVKTQAQTIETLEARLAALEKAVLSTGTAGS